MPSVSPRDVKLIDFNGDGKLDFATANQDANSVSIRYGDGTGSFTGSLELGVNSNAQSIDAADMDNDSIPDYEDRCPSTPSGNVVNGQGCTILK